MKKEQLKERRENLGLNQVDLANEIGVTSISVSRWERGQVEVPKWMDLVMEALEIRKIQKLQKVFEGRSSEEKNAAIVVKSIIDGLILGGKHTILSNEFRHKLEKEIHDWYIATQRAKSNEIYLPDATRKSNEVTELLKTVQHDFSFGTVYFNDDGSTSLGKLI